jgi:cell division protein FtsZ
MLKAGLADVAFAVLHTDARLMNQSAVGEKLLLGASLTRGLGAGGDADIGRAAAEAETTKLRELCAGVDLLILVAGLGGGTGSGVTPVLAQVARESGALVLAFAVLPFEFEGARRQQQAQHALRQLKTASDAVICLSNQKVCKLIDEKTTLFDAFEVTNDMLAQGVEGLLRLVMRQGLLDVDFAHLCRVVRGRQAESCFVVVAARGENRSREVLEQLRGCPLLDGGRALSEADAVLVGLVAGADLTLKEVNQLMEQIGRLCENAQLIMGAAVDPAMADRLSVTVVAAKRSRPDAARADAPAGSGRQRDPLPETLPGSGLELGEEETGQTPAERPARRFVPPAPELTPEQMEHLLAQQGDSAVNLRRKVGQLRQGWLPLEVVPKGRFDKSEPTIRRGEDLDTPTYLRRGIPLN